MKSKNTFYITSCIEIILFILFYCYILLWINPSLIDFVQQPVFYYDKFFLLDYLKYPGGITECITQFASQYYCYPQIGALIILVQIWAVSYLTGSWSNTIGNRKYILLIKLIPSVILLVLFSDYNFSHTTSLNLIITLLLFNFYLQKSGINHLRRALIVFISSVILYILCGGMSMFLYVSLLLIYETIYRRRIRESKYLILILIISCIIPFILTRFFYFITYKNAYVHLFVTERYYRPSVYLFVLYSYFPVVFVVQLLISKVGLKNKQNSKSLPMTEYISLSNIIFQSCFIFLLILTVFKFGINREQKLVYEVKYLGYMKKWEDILRIPNINMSNDRIVNFYTNRALYNNGRLSDDMFKYPQNWGKYALFLSDFNDYNTLMDNSDHFLDLRYISAAKHWTYEAQTIFENSPRVIKQLAIINIILGNKGAANMSLNILEKSSIHKAWTKKYRKYAVNPLLFQDDSLFIASTKMIPLIDFYIDGKNPDIDLKQMLEDNNLNKMAFEYLMAYYLLTNNLKMFTDNLKYLRTLKYKQMPGIYQEALLVYLTRKDSKRIDLQRYSIDPMIAKRFDEYAKIIISYNQNLSLAQNQLSKLYSDTYWYYLHYVSPVTNKKETKITEKK